MEDLKELQEKVKDLETKLSRASEIIVDNNKEILALRVHLLAALNGLDKFALRSQGVTVLYRGERDARLVRSKVRWNMKMEDLYSFQCDVEGYLEKLRFKGEDKKVRFNILKVRELQNVGEIQTW